MMREHLGTLFGMTNVNGYAKAEDLVGDLGGGVILLYLFLAVRMI